MNCNFEIHNALDEIMCEQLQKHTVISEKCCKI